MSENLHHSSVYQDKAPHEPVVSALIALRVVAIIFFGIFNHTWFGALIVFVLFINLVKNVVEYLQNTEARRNYRYHTEIGEVARIWIALIVVSIIMEVFFGKIWFAQIAPAVLQIKALEIAILYLVTLTQNNREKQQHHASTTAVYSAQLYGQRNQSAASSNESYTEGNAAADSEYELYTIRIKPAQVPDAYAPDETGQYCPTCGEKAEQNAKFCPYCGTSLDR